MDLTPFFFPESVRTLDASIRACVEISASCTACKKWQELDLLALREKVGRGYSLINRRTRCRITPGCEGWNLFHYKSGPYRPLWDARTAERWARDGSYHAEPGFRFPKPS